MTIVPPEGFRGRFLVDPAEREPFGLASGILSRTPGAVAVPRDEGDLRLLVSWAARTRTPLVPRGAGTGMPGGNVGPGVTVDLVPGFHQVGGVDPEHRRISAGAGATLAALNATCAPAGLHLPVDPSSGKQCTLGGMIANNSAGAHSVKYGAVRPWVISLDVVLADGSAERLARGVPSTNPFLRAALAQVDEILAPGRQAILDAWPEVRKNSSGYALKEYFLSGDALDLIIGSEGTLALVSSATFRLAPTPSHRGVAFLEFTTLEEAGEAIQSLLPLAPATCEMLDRTFLEIVREAGADADIPLAPDLEAVLLVEVEADSPVGVEEALEAVRHAVRDTAARTSLAVDPTQQERFWDVRHRASPIIAERSRGRVSMQFIEDSVVPVAALPEYVRLLRAVLERHHLPAVIFGHAGDGNLHVNPLVDVRAAGWLRVLEEVLEEIAHGVARLGGTLAGEHGDGRLRAPLLETIWGPAMVHRFRAVKEAFDPHGILNPGVILPLPGQKPFDSIRTYAP